MRVKKFSVVLLVSVLTLSVLTLFSFAIDPPVGTEILDGIQSNGCYIDTGYFPSSDTFISLRFKSTGTGGKRSLYGAADSASRAFGFDYSPSNRYFSAFYGSSKLLDQSLSLPSDYVTLEQNRNIVSVNGSQYQLSSNSFSLNRRLYLFGSNYYDYSQVYTTNCWIGACTIRDNSSLVRDYVPVRLTDGSVGLWDYVSGTFFAPLGGTFNAGNVIEVVSPSSAFSVSILTEGEGTASSSVDSAYEGDIVVLSATPSSGYVFSGWQVVQGNVSISNNRFVMPAEDVVVKAVFTPETPNSFSVSVSSSGSGSASSSVSAAQPGTIVTLSATPDIGYRFKQWNVLSGSVVISNDSFVMPSSDVSVQAVFEPIVYTISVLDSANGSASASASSAIVGDVITLTPSPDQGYSLSHWDITPSVALNGNSFVMPASNVTVKPVYIIQSAVSSGYTFNSGILPRSTRSDFETFDFSFGDQPSGKYLINIYHWGDSYDVNFYIYDSRSKYYPVTSADGVSTFIYDHSGGLMGFNGSFSIVNTDTSAVDGDIYGSINSSSWVGGEIVANGPLSWTFNIVNIVSVPYDLAEDSDFGIYSLIVGFLRDQFDDMKTFIASQFDKIAGDQQTKDDVDSAASELEKEVNDLNTLHGQLDTQASNLEQQFSNDFSVPSEVTGQTANLQLIYSGIFSSLGVFSIFIWLPVVLAVIKKLLRL